MRAGSGEILRRSLQILQRSVRPTMAAMDLWPAGGAARRGRTGAETVRDGTGGTKRMEIEKRC